MPSENYHWYENLTAHKNFQAIMSEGNYEPVPDDWYIVLTDVIGSTNAIERGKYKEVNIAGGIAVMAIANHLKGMDYPFLFGGDGITILIPPDNIEAITDIMADTRKTVKELYKLDLRVGVMPIKDIYDAGYKYNLCKLYVSRLYNQANFDGDGVDYAEERLKDKSENNPYIVPKDHISIIKADFMGFTCRWQDVKSSHDETIALIVKSRDAKNSMQTMKKVTNAIYKYFGTEEEYHPVKEEKAFLSFQFKYLSREAFTRAKSKLSWRYLRNLIKVYTANIIMWIMVKFQLTGLGKFQGFELRDIKQSQVISSDFRKYDGTLKMIIACSKKSRKAFESFLEEEYKKGELFYGVHSSDRALLTCMAHPDTVREVHFIDAADGGYALAAKPLKAQMKAAS